MAPQPLKKGDEPQRYDTQDVSGLTMVFSGVVKDKLHFLTMHNKQDTTSLQSIACQWIKNDWNLLLTGAPWYNSISDFKSYKLFIFKSP
ncbi:unnamed protein product [Aspergillus oryzae]|nr:unnamed protein product [Aspergillus oryzae]